jgi:hypothetical protein
MIILPTDDINPTENGLVIREVQISRSYRKVDFWESAKSVSVLSPAILNRSIINLARLLVL